MVNITQGDDAIEVTDRVVLLVTVVLTNNFLLFVIYGQEELLGELSS